MISSAWFLTPHQRSFGEMAPICTSSLPWRICGVTRRFDSSYCCLLDLAVAEEELAEGVLGGVRGGEDDLAVLPDDRALELTAAEDELPAARIIAMKLRTSGSWMRERSP